MTQRLSWVLNLLLLVGLVGIYYFHFSQKEELRFIKTNQLISQYKGAQAATQAFQQKSAQWRANIDTLNAELQRTIAQHDASKESLSAQERKWSEEEIQSKKGQLMKYQQGIQRKIQEEDQKLSQQVLQQVNSYIEKYGEKRGYRIILAATEVGNVVYAAEGIDITQEILAGLNSSYGNE